MATQRNPFNLQGKNATSSSSFLLPVSVSRNAALLVASTALVAFTLLVPACAQAAGAVSSATVLSTRTYNISAQPLGSALLSFGKQSSLQLTAPGELLRGVKTSGVHGQLTSQQALGQLLAGTGLSYAPSGSGVPVHGYETSRCAV
ncbi:STN domain-containing protein [Gluconacetobacter sacchari]|uniref:STN domain-containing protein n=1 Tax=Gluconacetobacter sacchari TaxID=92759 RepID=UPI0039B60D74